MTGRTISHYHIGEKIGSGGMGVVYRAQDLKLERTVAIKFLPPFLSPDKAAKDRFISEAKTVSSLDHPNICTVYEISETEDEQLFFTMAYYEGETLKDKLKPGPDRNGLSLEEATGIILQMAQGLGHAHAKGIIHRDIKPANIIITQDGIVKILDFGIAKLLWQGRPTQTGYAVGTVAYMSPEQTRNQSIDQRSDIWCLGVVLYEMICGHLPFEGDCDAAQIYAIAHENYTPLTCFRADAPKPLQAIIARCLAKNPQERYQTTAEFINDVEAWRANTPLTKPSRKFRFKKNIRKLIILPAIFVFLLITITLAYLFFKGEKTYPILSERMYVVLPFTVRGASEYAYLQDGMVDLLSMNLDQIGELHCVDPRALSNQIKKAGVAEMDIKSARNIARIFGAGKYVLGTLVVNQSKYRFNTKVYDTNNETDNGLPLTVEGDESQLFAMVDHIANEIIATSTLTPANRLQLLGSLSTRSLPALKAYLQGLSYDRAGEFQKAYDQYSTAVRIDSSYAQAWLQLSFLNYGFLFDLDQAGQAWAVANRHKEKLPARDQRYLEIAKAALEGDNKKIIDISAQIVQSYPDDVFGWAQYATTMLQVANQFGRSILESDSAFQKLLFFDPDNATNYQQYMMVLQRKGDLQTIDDYSKKLTTLGPNHEWSWPILIPRAFIAGDRHAISEIVRQALGKNETLLAAGINNSATLGKNFADVIPLIRTLLHPGRSKCAHVHGYLMLATLEVSKGKWQNAQAKLDSMSLYDKNFAEVFREMLHPDYYLRQSQPSIRQQTDEWNKAGNTADPHLNCESGFPELDFRLLPSMHALAEGLAAIQADPNRLSEQTEKLLKSPQPDYAASMIRIRAASLQASMAIQQQRYQEALDLLDREPVIIQFPYYWGPFFSLAWTRYLRAQALQGLGKFSAALQWYDSIAEIYFFDLPFRAPARFQSALIYEQMHNNKQAIQEYQQFLALWKDCDLEYSALRTEAQKRLNRLRGIFHFFQ